MSIEEITVQAVFGCTHTATITTTIDSVGPDVAMAMNELCPSCEQLRDDEEAEAWDKAMEADPCFHCKNLGMGSYEYDGDVSCAGCEHHANQMVEAQRTPMRQLLHNLRFKLYWGFHSSIFGKLYRKWAYRKCPF